MASMGWFSDRLGPFGQGWFIGQAGSRRQGHSLSAVAAASQPEEAAAEVDN